MNGKTYKSNRYKFLGGSSIGCARKQRIVKTYTRGTDTVTDKEIFATHEIANTSDRFEIHSGKMAILTESILGEEASSLREVNRQLFAKHSGNLRDALRELYDRYAER